MSKKILVTGGTGLVGGCVKNHLKTCGYTVIAPRREELDLTNSEQTYKYLQSERPDAVIAAAALVGGIAANIKEPVKFLVDNINMQNNLMLAASESFAEKLIFMSSSCVYPRESPQPMKEEYFLTGPFEPTNASYATAKAAGMQLAYALKSENKLDTTVLIPSNIYGPGDTFNTLKSHVASALVKKFVDARNTKNSAVLVWGTGEARRELTHVQDLANATELILRSKDIPFMINVGTGTDHSIKELANIIQRLSRFKGSIQFDPSKPDGMPRKVLDVSTLRNLGWSAKISLEEGIKELILSYENSSH